MWRSSKRVVVGCIQLIMRCGRNNVDVDDIDDISEYDIHDVSGNCINSFIKINPPFTVQCPPVHFQPQIFPMAMQQRQEDFQHRPDAPGTRRRSPPEIISKMIQALEELTESNSLPAVDKVHGSHQLNFKSSF
ncbi:PREDICTED: uncharacterized protein LOC107067040 [Polistes dominula]|uniref:Uncharacterized protein LOC107067040 n=1 Tax=Polistes dominula TaxID=743375 RepID=A0ABM1IBV1_POLDO|nr:PREDICTED: uncharacterized protein LOC107067040 [Polistes dominula]